MAGRGFKIADAWVEIHTDDDAARKGVRDLPRKLSPDADRAGRGVGDKLSQGIHLSIVRNSPLIAAAVGGALAAGAPVAIAGATALFGGIGAVAAAQSLQVREAWTALGRQIRDGAVADAAVLVPVYTQMAGQIGDAFQRMRPALRDAFTAVAPQIQTVTDGVIAFAENAMPGLVRAVERSGPVMDGLASLMSDVGTGLTQFFDAMSEHSGAAGAAFDALGRIIGALLPILGELLGTGAQLASVVLPPLAAILEVVAGALSGIQPLLGPIVAGLAAMKIAQSAQGWVGGLGDRLNSLKSSLTGMNLGMAGLGVVIAGIAADFANTKTEVDRWSNALLQGGAAAAAVRQEYEDNDYLLRGLDEWTGLAGSIEDAEAQMRAALLAMSPLERATTLVTQAENDLAFAMETSGAQSEETAAARRRYEAASAEVERQEAQLELAIDGVTSAMVEQAEQAIASIDSGFNYRRSVDQLEDAQANLAQTVRNLTADDKALRTTQEDVERAQLALEEQVYNTARAYGQQQADLTDLDRDSSAYARTIQTEMLGELYRLRDAAGPQMRAAIDTQIRALRDSGVRLEQTGRTTDATRGRVNAFSDAVNRIPAAKMTRVSADTAQANRNVDGLQRNIDNTRGKTVTIQVRAAGRFVLNPQGGLQEFAEGGFTGRGSKYQPAGIVHAGEVVWSQDDVRAHGGPDKVDEMRKFRGYADGGIVLRHDSRPVERVMEQVANAMENATPAVPALGSGSVAANVASLFATIRRAFPRAKLNSGYRPGDPGYHGLGRAVDLGESGFAGGAGRPYLAQMAAWIYRNYGARTKELIYTGRYDTTPDLKNGRALNYGAATNAAHRNHVHWAMANGGVIREPVAGVGLHSGGSYSFGERGPETVIPGTQPPAGGGSVYNLHLHMHGVDFSKQTDRRRILTEVRRGLVELERERS